MYDSVDCICNSQNFPGEILYIQHDQTPLITGSDCEGAGEMFQENAGREQHWIDEQSSKKAVDGTV